MDDSCDWVTLNQLLELRPFLTTRWVRSLLAAGTLQRRKLGGKLIFRPSEIDALIESSGEAG